MGKIRWSYLSGSLVIIITSIGPLTLHVRGQSHEKEQRTQISSVESGKLLELMDKAKRNTPESIVFVVQLADAKAVQAIPMLEEKFAQMHNELTEAKILSASVKVADLDKANVASALVRLGDKNDTYWDFLLQQATLAVDSNMPEYLTYNAQGKAMAGPSPEISAWTKAHNLPPAAMEETSLLMLPGTVGILGMTGDPRAIPLLRKALLSPSYLMKTQAARGLARIQDKDSIPFIVDACQKAPASAAGQIASASLVYFDNPEAQRAAEIYIPKDRLKALRESLHTAGAEAPH